MAEAKVAEVPEKAKPPARESHRFHTMNGVAYGTSWCGRVSAEELRARGGRDLGPNADPTCRECWELFMRGSIRS